MTTARRSLPPVRNDLADVAPYFSPQMPARFRMNTNESPYPPPAEVMEEVLEEIRASSLNRYPERDASGLLAALAEQVGWTADGVWAANGSNEVFMHLFLAFGGPDRLSLTFEPTYALHSLIARISGTRTVRLRRNEDFAVDLDEAVEVIRSEAPDLVILCSPNNPSGNCESMDTIRAIVEEAPGLVVVDEAYGDFAPPSETARQLLEDRRNLIIVKTFSKAWRLAGVRLGYLMGDPEVVQGIARVRLPYHLSSVAQAFGRAAIAHRHRMLDAVESIKKERDRIAIELQALGIKTFPSAANFVLFQVEDPDEIWEALYERGILIRNYSGYEGLEGCLRVTAGLPDETDAFLAGLREVLDA